MRVVPHAPDILNTRPRPVYRPCLEKLHARGRWRVTPHGHTDRGNLDLHSAQPDKIQFLSYTSDVTNNIKCGPRNPGTPVTVTYRPQSGGGEPLVVEFQDKK